jgi:histidyl-tRNA synthetase
MNRVTVKPPKSAPSEAGARLRSPLGTFDVLPDEAARRDEVEAAARRIFTAAGYRRIDTPTFEPTELFVRGVGNSTDIVRKQMYTFNDDDGRSLTLRPEGTAAICRAYVQHGMHKLPHPVRLWFHGSYHRQETPQAGRYRQFWQIGVEALGSEDPALDAECILLLTELLRALQVPGLRLRVSSLGSPATRASYRELLIPYLLRHEERLSPEVRERIELNPLRAFDSSDPGTRAVMASAPHLLDHLSAEDREHFASVLGLLDGVDVPYDVDHTLVRGLDYYTRTVFEFTSDLLGAQSAVGAGGRFDGLVGELGGPSTPACGGCAGIERVLLATAGQPVPRRSVDLYVACTGTRWRSLAFQLAADARHAGLGAQLGLGGRSLTAQLRQAHRVGARYVVILRDDGARLKDMSSGDQVRLEVSQAVDAVVRRVRAMADG